MAVEIHPGSVKLQGSLTKARFGENLSSLSPQATGEVIDEISDSLYIPLREFHVSRLDFAFNLSMGHSPLSYLPQLGVLLPWKRRNRRPQTELWLKALHQAVAAGCPLGSRSYGITLMSDNGSQPTSKRYEKELEALGISHVTTSYNNPKGNADTERFMRTFKEEVVWPSEFDSLEEAVKAADVFFRFYNEDYPHSTIGEQSPIDFEQSLNLNQVPVAA